MSEREERLIERIASELRKPVRVDPLGKARIMASVRAAQRPRPRGASRSWLARSSAALPLAGLGLAAALLGVVAIRTITSRPPTTVAVGPAAAAAPGHGVTSPVQFVLVAPAASNVSLVGDFNDWDATATPLRQSAPSGVWSVVVPLTRGRHLYSFVVDGTQWMLDPSAPQASEDDFGSPNSVVTVETQST